jgi:proteasome lid subunit RPN8/RPN11
MPRLDVSALGGALRAEMLAHAAEEAPLECCGLLVDVPAEAAGALHDQRVYVRSRNLRPDGGERFELDPEIWAAAEEAGTIRAVVHSHPHASAHPSMADRAGCEASGVPWLIVGWPSGAMVAIEPEGWQAPLVGREFTFGVLDCYTLIQDWYWRQWQVRLPDFAREDGFWERGHALYREGFPAAGFTEVAGEPQAGDVLLMRIRSEVENHAAVYLGDGVILHHLYGRPSGHDCWGHAWRTRTTAVLRHRSRWEAPA